MRAFLPLLPLSLLLTLCPLSLQAGGRGPVAYIGLHPEGAVEEGKRMVIPNQTPDGETHYFRISPEISIRHFSAYTPFPAEDGTWGASLLLNAGGLRAQEVMCTSYGGKLARIIVNGRMVDTLRIDRPAGDGRIIIWHGLVKQDLVLMDKKLKRLGGDDPKKL